MTDRILKFNFSKYDYPSDRIWIHIPYDEMAIKIVTFLLIIGFGLFGNCLIVRLILLNRALRTPPNIIIGNMAVANFMTLLICPPLFMMTDFFQNFYLGPWGCKLEGSLTAAFLITGVLNLCVITYDRLTAIALPKATRLTMYGAKIIIILTWLVGFLIASPLCIYRDYRERIWKNFVEKYCREDRILNVYWYVLITVMVWIPLAIMLICYTTIYYKVHMSTYTLSPK